jgi:ligand-binding sensor domain-containing protein
MIQLVLLCTFLTAQTSWTNYNSTNGLFSNSAIVITADKFNNIWIGLGSGSVGDGIEKFDGLNWTHFDNTNSGLPENDIHSLKADTSGNLWISFYGGSGQTLTGLTKFDGSTWTVYDTTNSAILSNYIYDIQIDKKNNIWLSCAGGISKFDGTAFTNYILPVSGSLVIEDSANVWIGVNGYGLYNFNPLTGTLVNYDLSNSSIPSNYISCIDIDTNGIIWLGFSFAFNGGIGAGGTNGGLATFDGTSFTTIWPFQNFYTGAYGLTVDQTNNIWVSTRCEGLYLFDGISWTNIAAVPASGCSFGVGVDKQNYVWYTEVYSGVWTNNPAVGIDKNPIKDKLLAFPNPATDVFSIETIFLKNERLTLINSFGKEILNQEIYTNSNKLEIQTRSLPAGIYYWQLLSNNQCKQSGKVIIVKE